MKTTALLSVLLAPSATARTMEEGASHIPRQRRRHLRRDPTGGGRVDEEKSSGGRVTSRGAGGGFYDLSLLTEDEKLYLVKTAYALTYHGDSIDWDAQRDNFVRAVMADRIRSRGGRPGGDFVEYADGSDYVGHVDDTLDVLDGNDDAYDGKVDDTLDDALADEEPRLEMESRPPHQQASRQLQEVVNDIDATVFDGYEYSKGSCPDAGSLGVPCAPPNLPALCNKYDRDEGSFRTCLDACKPAICCIHAATNNQYAPNCNADENCPQYNYCYIAWWKLHDTVGPALFLRVEQDDDFYDMDADEIAGDTTGDPFFTQLLLHHFSDINEVITDPNNFDATDVFLNETYWLWPVAGKIDVDN